MHYLSITRYSLLHQTHSYRVALRLPSASVLRCSVRLITHLYCIYIPDCHLAFIVSVAGRLLLLRGPILGLLLRSRPKSWRPALREFLEDYQTPNDLKGALHFLYLLVNTSIYFSIVMFMQLQITHEKLQYSCKQDANVGFYQRNTF